VLQDGSIEALFCQKASRTRALVSLSNFARNFATKKSLAAPFEDRSEKRESGKEKERKKDLAPEDGATRRNQNSPFRTNPCSFARAPPPNAKSAPLPPSSSPSLLRNETGPRLRRFPGRNGRKDARARFSHCVFSLGLVDGKNVRASVDPSAFFPLSEKRRERREESSSLLSLLAGFDPSARPVDRAPRPRASFSPKPMLARPIFFLRKKKEEEMRPLFARAPRAKTASSTNEEKEKKE